MSETTSPSFLQKLLNSKAAQLFVAMILGGLLMLVVVRFLYPNAESVQITLPGGKTMGVTVKSNQIEYQKLLQQLFAEENLARAGVLSWLKENQQLYQIKDHTLADGLSGLLPDNPHASAQETLQQRTERLQKAIEDTPSIKELRRKSQQHDAPFQFIGEIVRVKFNNAPPQTRAFVPIGSPLAGRVIELYNQTEEKQLSLRCEEGISGADGTKVMLNRAQFAYLFGSVAKGTGNAIVIVVNSNNQLSNM